MRAGWTVGQAPLMQPDSFYKNTITPTQGQGAHLLLDWLENGRDTADRVKELRRAWDPRGDRTEGLWEARQCKTQTTSQSGCLKEITQHARGDLNLLQNV